MKINNLEKKDNIVKVLLLVVLVVFILHTIYESVSLYNCDYCSAPWHVAVIMNLFFYALPFMVLIGLKIYFSILLKRRETNDQID